MSKPHAITPTDTRDVDTLALPVHLPQASPVAQAMFHQACLRMGDRIARQQREAAERDTPGA